MAGILPSTPSTAESPRPEEPTAAAHLSIRLISLVNIDAQVTVPGQQAQHVIRAFASLTGLTIMAIVCPAVTLTQGRHILPPGWMVGFLAIEIAAGLALAALPYRRKTRTTSLSRR